MPIKKENKHRYPDNWNEIRAQILLECQSKCEFCGVENYSIHPETGSKVVLTIAHLDHIPENVKRENLKALCQKCHNKYDAPHRAQTRRKRMAVSTEFQNEIFKYKLNSNKFVADCCLNKPEIASKVFELMSRDKLKPVETTYMQFKRIHEIIVREEARKRKNEDYTEKVTAWKQAYQNDLQIRITPERIKQMLDDMLDRGEIDDKKHEYGYKGLAFLFGYKVKDKPEVGIPF